MPYSGTNHEHVGRLILWFVLLLFLPLLPQLASADQMGRIFPIEAIFPWELTCVQTPFLQNSF